MAKCKTFYSDVRDKTEHDENIQMFLDELSENGHTFINANTICFGKYLDDFRTEIIYIENPTRKVIFEKAEA